MTDYDALFPQIDSLEIYSDFKLQDQQALSSLSFSASPRQSQIEAKVRFEAMTLAAVQVAADIDPFESDLPVGVEIPTIDAVDWVKGRRGVDIRPRVVDTSTGQSRLLDSGAQLSATCRVEGDVPDDSVNLIAVNGSKIYI